LVQKIIQTKTVKKAIAKLKLNVDKFKRMIVTWKISKYNILILSLLIILLGPIILYSLFLVAAAPDSAQLIWHRIIEFYRIWPLHQWISSLITLIILYWGTGKLYNRWLSNKGGWLTWQTRMYLIATDLSMNFVIGVHYMYFRDTFMGQFMLTCPIALSPFIFLIELFCVYLFHRFSNSPLSKKKNSVN